MKKTLLISLLLLLSLLQQAVAQSRSISGRVTDRTNGEGLPGATVLVKGTSVGVSTNADGTFALDVPTGGTTLIITSVGYISSEQAIGNESRINIGLGPDTKQLSEVVVVGYGEQSKALLTTAQSTISNKEFANQPVAGVDQLLQGRASGVQVTSSSGTPGGGISVRIRGNNSITASSQPLYVIDGVPIIRASLSDIGVGGQGINSLSDINPQDIASMEVLKDAAASAIYGSRGANGVVIITTKRGAAGRTKINFDMYTGTQQVINKLDVLNGPETVALFREARNNVGLSPNLTGLPTNPEEAPSTNWQDEIFRSAPISNYTLTMSGGDQKTRLLATGTFYNQEGIVIGSGFQRGSARFNVDHNISDKVKIGTNLSLSRSKSNRIYNDNNIYGVVSGSILLASYVPVYLADGVTYGTDPTGLSPVANPVAQATEATFDSRSNRVVGSTFLEIEPVRNLRVRTNFGIDYINVKEDQFEPSTLPQASESFGSGTSNSRGEIQWLNETTASYSKTVADAHTITGLLGFSAQRNYQEGQQVTTTNFPGNGIRTVGAGAVNVGAASDITEWSLASFFGRLNYDFKGKYLVQGSLRYDGSSRFGSENQWGVFPAASVAWRISEEAFLKDNVAAISNLKLRAGFGQTGNLEIGNFGSRELYSPGFYNGRSGLVPSQLGNPKLTWEKNRELNIGLDLGLFNDRVQFSANAFKRVAPGLLLNRQLPLTSGFASILQNSGELENRGLEFDLTTDNFRGEGSGGFNWSTTFNVSIIRNEITKLITNKQLAGFANILQVGQPLGSFYGYKVDRIYQSQEEIDRDNAAAAAASGNALTRYQLAGTRPGDIRFQDLDGNGRITAADQTILGSAQPKFFGGLTNNLSWKGFDLSFFFQYTYGNKVYNNTRAFGEGMNSVFGQLAATRDRWTPTNTDTDMPRAAWGDPNQNRRTSDRWLEDGSFVRLKTATLGYNLPETWLKPVRIQSARIYLAGQNLLTFTDYKGLDPEVNTFNTSNTSQGTDFLTFPQARVYQVGVNLGF